MRQDWVFQCEDRRYGVREVLAAAAFRGELEPIRRFTRESLAALAAAEDQGHEVDDALLQQASEQYRQQRGLATAAATAAWLERYGLDLDDFVDFLERHIIHTQWNAHLDAAMASFAPTEEEVDALVMPETVFSGALTELAAWLARRVALPRDDGEDTTEERVRFLERAGLGDAGVPGWCARQECSEDWLEELLRLEVRYRRKRSDLLNPANFTRAMRERRQDLMCIEVEAVVFESENAAREAYLCIVEDGEPLDQVSARAHGKRRHATLFLEGLDDATQQKFLSAPPGHTFPPIPEGEDYVIHHVARKIEPDLKDEAIRQRLEHGLITRYFDELAATRITWAQ